MSDTPRDPGTGRTSWKRFAVAAVPTVAAAGALVTLMANGAIAASFAVSGQSFKVSGSSLDGTGFVQYGSVDAHALPTEDPNDAIPVVVSAIKQAKITNLCQSVVTPLPILGDFTLQIHAGSTTPVTAENIFIDMTQLDGDEATFQNIEIGVDAQTLDKGPAGAQGGGQLFSQQADSVHIDNFKQIAWATNAGTFKLPGLSLQLVKGKHECF